MSGASSLIVRNTQPADFAEIIEICREVYPDVPPWGEKQLASHLAVFPEGQLVAELDGRLLSAGDDWLFVYESGEAFVIDHDNRLYWARSRGRGRA